MEISLAVILSYITGYLLAFVISLLGAFTAEMMAMMRTKRKISVLRIITPGIFDGFLLSALQPYFKFTFSSYALVCFILGMWGMQIVDIMSNYKFVSTFLKTILKASPYALAKAAAQSMTEIDEEETKKNKRKSSSKATNSAKEEKKDETKSD